MAESRAGQLQNNSEAHRLLRVVLESEVSIRHDLKFMTF